MRMKKKQSSNVRSVKGCEKQKENEEITELDPESFRISVKLIFTKSTIGY